MSSQASHLSEIYLEKMGVEVKTGIRVTGYDGSFFETKTLIWAAGIKANVLSGFTKADFGRGGRVFVNRNNPVKGYENIFAIEDLAVMQTPKYPEGHLQVAQAAIQQAKILAKNMKRLAAGKDSKSAGENDEFIPEPSVFVADTEGKIVFEYINPDFRTRLSAGVLTAVLKNL